MADQQVQTQRIPFGNLQASGTEELGGGSPVAMNVVADSTGTIFRRPGIRQYLPSIDPHGIAALYETAQNEVYAVVNGPPARNIYFVTAGGAVNLSMVPEGNVDGTLKPIVAETDALVVFAGGKKTEKVVKANKLPSRLGGDPPEGSHILAIANRLVENDVTGTLSQLHYSDQAVGTDYSGNEDWSTALVTGIFTAAARPDPIVAVHENTNEIFVFGPSSLQVYGPDATANFAPVVNKEVGCSAPYSVVKSDQNFVWLDHLRRFVMSDGRQFQVLSDPIQKTLQSLDTVSDCFGYRITMGYIDAGIWVFPSEGLTFCYQKDAGWGQWSGWDGAWAQFPVTAATRIKVTGETMVGTDDGSLGILDMDTTTDFGDQVNAYVVTGFQDRGTDNFKSCRKVRFTLRRGRTTGVEEPYFLLSWRDGLGPWEPGIPISLGSAGENNPVVELWSLGTYRRRQWKMDFKSSENLALVSASEEFEVLPS